MSSPGILARQDGATIVYRRLAVAAPGVVFLGGFRSDMTGTKASFLAEHSRRRGWAYVRFDYFGHGASSGDAALGRIGRWAEDTIAVLDALTEGPPGCRAARSTLMRKCSPTRRCDTAAWCNRERRGIGRGAAHSHPDQDRRECQGARNRPEARPAPPRLGWWRRADTGRLARKRLHARFGNVKGTSGVLCRVTPHEHLKHRGACAQESC